jgi:hypothetical protein
MIKPRELLFLYLNKWGQQCWEIELDGSVAANQKRLIQISNQVFHVEREIDPIEIFGLIQLLCKSEPLNEWRV